MNHIAPVERGSIVAWTYEAQVRKPLIQQSYEIHRSDEHAAEHRFLREPKTLSPAAVIFHRDKCQDLMGCEICCKPAHTDRKIQ